MVCLRDQSIDNNNSGIGRLRRDRGLGNKNGCVVRGQGIYNTSNVSETTTEAMGGRQQALVIYDDDGGVGGGRLTLRLQ